MTLAIGEVVVRLGRYPEGTLTTLVFTLSRPEFDRTAEGARVRVRYDPDSQGNWDLGVWHKARLDRELAAADRVAHRLRSLRPF